MSLTRGTSWLSLSLLLLIGLRHVRSGCACLKLPSDGSTWTRWLSMLGGRLPRLTGGDVLTGLATRSKEPELISNGTYGAWLITPMRCEITSQRHSSRQ